VFPVRSEAAVGNTAPAMLQQVQVHLQKSTDHFHIDGQTPRSRARGGGDLPVLE